MPSIPRKPHTPVMVTAALLLSTPCTAQTVYNNNFESGDISGWSLSITAGPGLRTSLTPTGRRFLGDFGNASASLALGGLPAHTHMRIRAKLYVIGNWVGNTGPDAFVAAISGQSEFLNTTFSNINSHPQAFGGFGVPNGSYAAGTGADLPGDGGEKVSNSDLGYGNQAGSIYSLDVTQSHTAGSANLVFQTGGGVYNQGETWGLDDVRVDLIDTTVPEPASAGLILPCLTVALLVRRRVRGHGPPA